MREVRVPLADVQPGEVVVRITGHADFNSRFVALHEPTKGHAVSGVRGGRYTLTAAGAERLVIVELTNGRRPVVRRDARVTVLREATEQ